MNIIKELRKKFPHGHIDFIPITLTEIELHSKKNYDYASGGHPLGNFERVAKIFSLYPNIPLRNPVVIALTYAMKQLDQVLWSLSRGYEGDMEGINDRLADISVYSKLAMILNKENNATTESRNS